MAPPHVFVVARLLPSRSAEWTSKFGPIVAEALATKPFVALRVHYDNNLGFPVNSGTHSFRSGLFLVSHQKPPPPYHDFCLPLAAPASNMTDALRLNKPLSDQPLYLHLYPLLKETHHHEPKEPMRPSSLQLDSASYERMSTFFRYKQPSLPPPPTSRPLTELNSGWRDFNTPSVPESGRQRDGFVFDVRPFTEQDHVEPDVVATWRELILCQRILEDYSWWGVTNTVQFLLSHCRTGRNVPPPAPPMPLTYTGNLPDLAHDLSSLALVRLPAPIDGDPVTLSVSNNMMGDEDGDSPIDALPIVEPAATRTPERSPRVVVIDIFSTIFNMPAAARNAVGELLPNATAYEVDRWARRLTELAALYHVTSYADTAADAVRRLQVELPPHGRQDDVAFQAALARLLSPPVMDEAAAALASLTAKGLEYLGFSTVDQATFIEHMQPALQSISLPILPLPDTCSALFLAATYQIQSIVSYSASKNVPLDTVLVASSSSVRALEPAAQAGIPTMLVLRPKDWETEALDNLYTVRSTMTSTVHDMASIISDPREWTPSAPKFEADRWINPLRIKDIYQIHRIYGAPNVFDGVNWLTNERIVAKIALPLPSQRLVEYEMHVYHQLAGHPATTSLPWAGRYSEADSEVGEADVLVMERLGPTLDHLRRACRGTFSLKTVLMIATQLLDFIEYAHSRGIILRDIKPQNFAISSRPNEGGVIRAFDFGVSKLYVIPSTGEHIPYRTGRIMTGTVLYASHWVAQGIEPSRRDDLAAWCHTLLEQFHGCLPWERIVVPHPDLKEAHTAEMKQPTNPAMVAFIERSPPVLRKLMQYVLTLGFTDKPDYARMRGIIDEEMRKNGWLHDTVFDWSTKESAPNGTLVPGEYQWIVREGQAPPHLPPVLDWLARRWEEGTRVAAQGPSQAARP